MATRDRRSSTSTVSAAPGAGSGALVRLGWMIAGPLVMLMTCFTIFSTPPWSVGMRDAVFWSGAMLALALRYLDIARFHGQTATGESATMAHYRRYAIGLIVVGAVGWTLAQAVQV